MDRITESLLTEFSHDQGIMKLPEEKRFEHFAAYVILTRHHNETFDSADFVIGTGNDTGIDAVAILVNNSLVTDVESFEELAKHASSLDVHFIFVQAERSSGFDASKIGNFGFGVTDFFREQPQLPRNQMVSDVAAIASAIFGKGAKFKHGNPTCRLYYVTTGKWVGDQNLEVRRDAVKADLKATNLFREVDFVPVDVEKLQKLYHQSKNAVSRTFRFEKKNVIPSVPGVTQAFIGFLPVPELLKILTDDNGELIAGIYYDNVRDFQGENEVNLEIRKTLESPERARFVLMNNGITIIARRVQPTGDDFTIEDYQIVNGCQTTNVLFNINESAPIDASVMVPVRLISTEDENVTRDIIRATNRQTEVKEDQFFAVQDFPKELEQYFQTFPDTRKLYYERRSRQYDRLSVEKTRIVTPSNMIRAFAAMFLDEPHRTTRDYSSLAARIGRDIFVKGHRPEPYYVAAFALYKLEYFFRNLQLERKYRPARFHILLAARILVNPETVPPRNSHAMEKFCKQIMEVLWEPTKGDELLASAARIAELAAGDNFHRDNIRTEPFTKKVISVAKSKASKAKKKAEN